MKLGNLSIRNMVTASLHRVYEAVPDIAGVLPDPRLNAIGVA